LVQSELSYINHIRPGQTWKSYEDIGEIFPDFSWRRGDRFLPPPERIHFRSNHMMSKGRLNVAIMSAKSTIDGSDLIRFDLTARSALTELGADNCWQWYNDANTWIVDAFIDLTSKHMQRDVWKRVR
jgi:hypothetical protein